MSTIVQILTAVVAALGVIIVGWAYAKYLLGANTPQKVRSRATIAIVVLMFLSATGIYVVVTTSTATPVGVALNVYSDVDALDNHFTPSGVVGDTGDITINESWPNNPHSGTSSIMIRYSAEGNGPYTCEDEPPCKWAGTYWQTPPHNWGEVARAGFDLRTSRRLTFWARSDTETSIEFQVGGITSGPYPDSIQPPRSSDVLTLSSHWQQFEIDLTGADLSYVIGGFAWFITWSDNNISNDNARTLVFYLDDIWFEK